MSLKMWTAFIAVTSHLWRHRLLYPSGSTDVNVLYQFNKILLPDFTARKLLMAAVYVHCWYHFDTNFNVRDGSCLKIVLWLLIVVHSIRNSMSIKHTRGLCSSFVSMFLDRFCAYENLTLFVICLHGHFEQFCTRLIFLTHVNIASHCPHTVVWFHWQFEYNTKQWFKMHIRFKNRQVRNDL